MAYIKQKYEVSTASANWLKVFAFIGMLFKITFALCLVIVNVVLKLIVSFMKAK